MTINTESIRDAAEVLDTVTSQLPDDHPLALRAVARAKDCVTALYRTADQADAQAEQIAQLREAVQGLLDALPSATTHPAIKAARAALENAACEKEHS